MAQHRSQTRIDAAVANEPHWPSVADLHEQLGRALAQGSPTFVVNERRHDPERAHFRDLQIDARVNKHQFQEAARHLATLTPERRAELEAEWNEGAVS